MRLPCTSQEMAAIKMGAATLGTEAGGGAGGGVGGEGLGEESGDATAGPPRLKILYFTPAANVRHHLSLDTSLFLFPDDKTVKGSAALFSALVGMCVVCGYVRVRIICSCVRLGALKARRVIYAAAKDALYLSLGCNLT